jgi:type VII ESX secretion system EccE translocon-like protein
MPAGEAPDRTYGGWQPERVAFLFGLSSRRAAILGSAILVALLPVLTARMAEAVACWPATIVLAVTAMVRVQGRTGDEWLASAASYAAIRAQGQHRFAGGPCAPPPPPGAHDSTGPLMELPGILAPLRLLSVPAGAQDLAVVSHALDKTFTAVARLRYPGIALADSARREQRVDAWGALLASLCAEDSPLIRIQALQRLIPDPGVALRAWHEDHLVPGAPDLALTIARQLLDSAPAAACRHEAYLAVTMDARHARGAIRAAGGGDAGAAAVLVRRLRALTQALAGAELEVQDWLGARDLAEVIRVAYDPGAAGPLDARRALAAAASLRGEPGTTLAPGTGARHAGPVHAEALPGRYVHDGGVSASYWVQDWPRSHAYCTALAPLLTDAGDRKSLGMIFEPLSPRTAERTVMRERTQRQVAVRMRQRTGQVVPEHERAAMAVAARQDAERAAGHGLVRFTGYVTVTVTEPAALEDACAALEADAAAARIELRRMWFAQDTGFAVGALPLGLGLPSRRW